jgi:hypothetical protein
MHMALRLSGRLLNSSTTAARQDPEREELADFLQRESESLSSADELHSLNLVLRVLSVAR